MPTSNKKSVAKLIAMTLGVFALLLVAAVGIPVLMSQLAPSVLPSFEGPAKRAELEAILSAMLKKIDRIEPAGDAVWRPNNAIRALEKLPLTLIPN